MASRLRNHLPVVLALALLGVLAALDYVVPEGGWYANHPMSSSALSAVFGFLAAGLFLDGWLKDREAARLEDISSVAYRSLAQYANDAGRSLLAPLAGADLFSLAIPLSQPTDVLRDRERLERFGHPAFFVEQTGSWQLRSAQLDPVLADLLHDPDFVRQMFRTTAQMRRRLQEVTALWAPVMLLSKAYVEDLCRLSTLTDAMELLQEHWRKSGLLVAETAPWVPDPPWISGVSAQFWQTISLYEALRDEFGDRARLPSDVIVRRRVNAL